MWVFSKRAAILALCGSMALVGGTTLSRAVIANDLVEVKRCVQAGERVNEIDQWGWTPLMWAVWYRYPPITRYLLANGANPNIRAEKDYGQMRVGATAIILVAYYGQDELAEILIRAGANPTLADNSGQNAFDYARKFRFNSTLAVMKKWKNRRPI